MHREILAGRNRAEPEGKGARGWGTAATLHVWYLTHLARVFTRIGSSTKQIAVANMQNVSNFLLQPEWKNEGEEDESRNPISVSVVWIASNRSCASPSWLLFSPVKRCQWGFPSPAWPPKRDASPCGSITVSGGEVRRRHHWRLRSDIGLFC